MARRGSRSCGFTLDTSHAALFRTFAAAYPSLFGLASDDELELERYVEELGPATEVAHVSDAHGLLGEGLPYGAGELDLDPVVARLGELVPLHRRRDQRARPGALAGHEGRLPRDRARARGAAGRPWRRAAAPAARSTPSTGRRSLGRRDPVPAVLELQERFGGRRVLITGGGGSIGGALATLLLGFRPERVTRARRARGRR